MDKKNKLLNTDTIIIFWNQRQWKSLLSNIIASERINRIFSNSTFTLNWFVVSEKFYKISQLLDYDYFFKNNDKPWFFVCDEVGFNFNSKDSASIKNRILSDFLFLQWKFNMSSIFISQRYNSVPVDIRELASLIIEVKKRPRFWTWPLFECIVYNQVIKSDGYDLIKKKTLILDIIWLQKKYWLNTDTLETSIVLDDSKEFLELYWDLNKYRLQFLNK